MKPPSLASDDAPEVIELHYQRAIEGIELLHGAITQGQPPDSFFGYTRAEAYDALVELRREVDQQMSLALVASFEALFRIDCFNRIHYRMKSGIGPRVRGKDRTFALECRLEEILDLWKEVGVEAHRAGDFKKLLERRHWLAHGRYWDDSTTQQINPLIVRTVADALSAEIQQRCDDVPFLA
ncbi:MAG: hypothetical protein IT463_08345 [Planctomycetes bacterium]|nr:hypothetical protein [Planctomycetota bacterium]